MRLLLQLVIICEIKVCYTKKAAQSVVGRQASRLHSRRNGSRAKWLIVSEMEFAVRTLVEELNATARKSETFNEGSKRLKMKSQILTYFFAES